MPKAYLTTIRHLVVDEFPLSPAQGDTVVHSYDGHQYTFDGTSWQDNTTPHYTLEESFPFVFGGL